MSIREHFTKATDTTLLQIDDAIRHARVSSKDRNFQRAEAILWAAFDESNLFGQQSVLSTFLGETSVGQKITDHTIELLAEMAEVYEIDKQYLEAAACYHKSIPPDDRLDTYAWQRCFSLQDKVQEQTGISYNKQEWETLLNQTWETLMTRAEMFKKALTTPQQEEAGPAPDTIPEPIAYAPVHVAA